MARFIFGAFCLLVLSMPVFAFAQIFPGGPSQLVPVACVNPDSCGTCEFVSLINNVIDFVVFFATILATLVIIYGGFRLVTSGGDVSAKKAAKDTIVNVIIGYVIVLAAFLIINTLLSVLLPGDSPVLNWQRIECIYPSQVRESSLGGIAGRDSENSLVIAPSPSPVSGGRGTINPPNLSASGGCNASLIQPYFGGLTGAAQCIISKESVCGTRLLSTSDVMRNDPNRRPFSVGLMQINLTVHQLIGCGSATLNCPAAFNGKNFSATVRNETLYRDCVAAAQNSSCNLKNGRRIYDDRARRQPNDPWADWSTAAACGLR